MKGSEKQVAWAQEIINDKVATLKRNIELAEERKIMNKGRYLPHDEKWIELAYKAIDALNAMDDAKHIIERVRNVSIVQDIDRKILVLQNRGEI